MKNKEQTNKDSNLMRTGECATKKQRLLEGIFIDPWNQTISTIELTDDLADWRKLLACRYVERIVLASREQIPPLGEYQAIDTLDLWCDEEFLISGTPNPGFRFYYPGSEQCEIIFGYGLIIGGQDRTGNSVSFPMALMALPIFCSWIHLAFETLEGLAIRFPGNEFIPEKLRSIEADLPGRVRTLSRIEAVIGRQS